MSTAAGEALSAEPAAAYGPRMLTRRPSPEHQEAVSRRLALLSAELAGVRERARGRRRPGAVHAHPRGGAVPTRPSRSHRPSPWPSPRRCRCRAGTPLAGSDGAAAAGARHPARPRRPRAGPARRWSPCWSPPGWPSPAGGWSGATQDGRGAGRRPSRWPASPRRSRPPAAARPAATTASPAGTVTVDVAGKVRRPGIVVLDTGARVVDALKAAGGARPGVDLGCAQPRAGPGRRRADPRRACRPRRASRRAALPTPAPGGPLVNLNTATQVELESLPDVGPVTAEAILAWRDRARRLHGRRRAAGGRRHR